MELSEPKIHFTEISSASLHGDGSGIQAQWLLPDDILCVNCQYPTYFTQTMKCSISMWGRERYSEIDITRCYVMFLAQEMDTMDATVIICN